MDKKIGIIISSFIVALIFLFGAFLQSTEKKTTVGGESFVSRAGLHWHTDLSIIVKGKPVVIPADIGIGRAHNPMHTHEEPGVIHMEFPALVYRDDLLLGKFFQVWGKDIRSFGANMKMTVNGVENMEFENYEMKDKDKIVLTFE
ncbi:MAG: hypothetical protein HZB11_01180 [Candidatus Yonathbacteria bacterium]|nr:hypothetical protein [Candidatus Yonathbacteria bacterium]